MPRPTHTIILQVGNAISFVPKSSVGGALRQQVVDAPDVECQLVEAETDLDQNPSFPGAPTSADWVMQGFGSREGLWLSLLTTACPLDQMGFAVLASRRRSGVSLRIVEGTVQPMRHRSLSSKIQPSSADVARPDMDVSEGRSGKRVA